MEEQVHHTHQEGKNWYDRHHKTLLIIPIIMLLASLLYLAAFYQQHGDLIQKDVSLTGGTSITVFDNEIDSKVIQESLKRQFPDLAMRSISDIRTGRQHGFTVESQQSADVLREALEKQLGYNLTSENSSTEFSGSALSSGFYTQLIHAVIVAFLLMGLVVFIIFGTSLRMKLLSGMITSVSVNLLFNTVTLLSFLAVFGFLLSFLGYAYALRKAADKKQALLEFIIVAVLGILLMNFSSLQSFLPFSVYILLAPLIIFIFVIYTFQSVPSIAIIIAAFADIIMTLAAVDVLGMRISGAGIVAFLMLIGYSVDTDILLTSRLLKNHEGSINSRILGAFKTGITMTLAAIAAVAVSLAVIYSFSETLRQIFQIILIGLFFDIFNTWITNASILKWYMEARKLP
ncbi:MAG: hypothetical protein AABY00_02565 [Nanoarchaeota archaeon]